MKQRDAVWSTGPVGGPQANTRTGGVSPLSLLTFFAAAKKVSAAPHRGNARSTDTKSRMPAQKPLARAGKPQMPAKPKNQTTATSVADKKTTRFRSWSPTQPPDSREY
ncbi:hypothetical protein FRZ40_05060 [Paraburkholderia azotifigens]|uniref:Uncharacterized protein n=1 Tax=Paraburkholderia azotifigens TaxID=2057004 RepID=A0A5C6VQZ1_9BURK|nr:hypothetical protein FRZ40_05060 [Paraburkholderia azotifigens]